MQDRYEGSQIKWKPLWKNRTAVSLFRGEFEAICRIAVMAHIKTEQIEPIIMHNGNYGLRVTFNNRYVFYDPILLEDNNLFFLKDGKKIDEAELGRKIRQDMRTLNLRNKTDEHDN
jgi:hypothetical protein